MATKTTKTVYVKNTLDQKYAITPKGFLKEAIRTDRHPYTMALTEIHQSDSAGLDRKYLILPFTNEHLTTVDVWESGKSLRIGCQSFSGKNATAILKAAKKAIAKADRLKAKAATA